MSKLTVFVAMFVGSIFFILSVNAQQPEAKTSEAQVYFFSLSQFDKGHPRYGLEKDSMTYSVTEEAITPTNENNARNIIAAVYLGEYRNPNPNYSNIKMLYTFKVYHHKLKDPLNCELIGSYNVKANLSRRRIWMELSLADYGTYTIKVFRRFFKDPIAEGIVVLKRDR